MKHKSWVYAADLEPFIDKWVECVLPGLRREVRAAIRTCASRSEEHGFNGHQGDQEERRVEDYIVRVSLNQGTVEILKILL